MNLFALTDEPSRRVLRMPMAQNIQSEIERLFREQEASFASCAQEQHAFDGKYKPDDDECLFIDDYDDIDNVHGAVANPLAVPEINPDFSEFMRVKALFSGYTTRDGKKIALIQSFDRRKIISPTGLSIFHSGEVYRRVDGVGLTLDSRLAATLTETTLRFFSFHVVRQIFDLTQYFVEATNSDLLDFAKCPILHLDNEDALVATADAWIRRKVTLIAQSKVLDNVDLEKMKEVADRFKIALETKIVRGTERIVLPQGKADLKKLLRFFDEDYYQSALQNLNFLTNSKRPA